MEIQLLLCLASPLVSKTMDNRGGNRDSDRDRDYDRDRGGGSRRSGNDRDERREPSSTSPQPNRTEEEETSYYRSQIAPRSTNITTNRVVPSSTSNVVMERFYSYGIGSGIPLKPGGKSAAVVAIQ